MREKDADALWENPRSVIGGSACDVWAAVLDRTLTDAPDWLLLTAGDALFPMTSFLRARSRENCGGMKLLGFTPLAAALLRGCGCRSRGSQAFLPYF